MRSSLFIALILAAVLSLLGVSCSSSSSPVKLDAAKVSQLVATAETLGYLKADEAQAISQALALVSEAQADSEFGRDTIATARALASAAAKSGRLPPQYAAAIELALVLTSN
jgi:hypothetical protein